MTAPIPLDLRDLDDAMTKRDAREADCPINRPGLRRTPKVCPKCGATASESCVEWALANAEFVASAKAILAQIRALPA